jgi:O-antigen ligase
VVLAAFGMLLLHAMSALLSIRPAESIDVLETWLLEGILLALLVANAVRTREEIRAATLALLAAGAVMGAVALAQQILGPAEHPFFGLGQLDSAITDSEGRMAQRLAGPIGETNRFAQIMAVLIPLGAGMTLAVRGRARAFYALATLLILAGMVFAFSRGAIVALALALPFALAFGLVRLRQLAAVAVMGVVVLAAMPHYAERVLSIGQIAAQAVGLEAGGMRNADGAARGRMTEMQAAGLLFLEHPLLGAGPGLAPYYYADNAGVVGGKVRPGERRSHNLYLQLAAETGLIGLTGFLIVVGLALLELDRARRRQHRVDRVLWAQVVGLQLAVLISLITSLFLHAAYIRYFWLLIGLGISVSAQPGAPALAAFLSRALRETAERLRAAEARG